jgi:hypothetical protein
MFHQSCRTATIVALSLDSILPRSRLNMLTRLRTLLALLLWATAASTAGAAPDDIVIIIANQDYRGTVPKVEYADRDGEALAKAAREVMKVPGERIVIERNLTYAGFLAWFGREGEGGPELERVKARLGRASTIVFFYSGHGMPAKRASASEAEAFLLPVDTPPALAGELGYSVANIRRALAGAQRSRAPEGQVALFLEACFSGSSGAGRIAAETSSVRILPGAARMAEPRIIEIAASGPDQEANWDRERGLGLFTDALVDGLYGAADANRDGHITAAELAAYTGRRIDGRITRLYPSPRRYQSPTLAGDGSVRVASITADTPSRDPEAKARVGIRCATMPRSGDAGEIRAFMGQCGPDCPCLAALEARLRDIERDSTTCRVEGEELDRLSKRGPAAKGQIEALVASAACPDVKARAEQTLAGLAAPPAASAAPPPSAGPPTAAVPGALPDSRVTIRRALVRLRQSYVVERCGFVITPTARARALGRGVYEGEVSIDGAVRAVRSGDVLAPSGPSGGCKIAASVRPSGDVELNGECQCGAEAPKIEPVPTPAGRVFRDNKRDQSMCSDCPEMAVIPAGYVLMSGRRITFAKPFAIGRYEVTFAEWDACVGAKLCKSSPVDEGWGRGRRPVMNVSGSDIGEYLAYLAAMTGQSYRLPSESEWEYAARAGTATAYFTGDVLSEKDANVGFVGDRRTVPVGSYRPNAFGLLDMHGNVWEVVEDCWREDLSATPLDGKPVVTPGCQRRVMRGGSWNFPAPEARSGYRTHIDWPAYSVYSVGFRVARDLP